MAAEIDGRALSGSSAVELHPDRPTELGIELTNSGSAPVSVRAVRLEGRVLGLTFFSISTAVDIRVAPGTTQSRRFTLDLRDLDGEATGLIPGTVKLLDGSRHELAAQHFTADVTGSIWSVYGLFGFTALFLTAVALAGVLLALARHRLPFNRAGRGLRFAVVGIGAGVALIVVFSVLRVIVPTTSRWLPILVVTTAVAFGIGYLTPTPDDGEDDSPPGPRRDPELDQQFQDSLSGPAVARRTPPD